MANKPMSDDIISEMTKKMLSYFRSKDTNKKNAKKRVTKAQNLEARKKALAKKSLSIIKKDTNIKSDKAPTKKVIVTKEQLKKSGLSLRDYMNFLKSQKTGRTITRDSRFDKKKKAKGANT